MVQGLATLGAEASVEKAAGLGPTQEVGPLGKNSRGMLF